MARMEISYSRASRRGVMAAVLVLTLAACARPALAGADLADLQVVDRETGQTLPVWADHGRLFIAGQPGARYSLRVANHTGGRVLVVLSVDGVNIITGQTAGYDQRGYVLAPYQRFDMSGWRKSDTEVAAFSFAPLPQSYAARTGRPDEVGVIGMAVFRERALVEPLTAPFRALSPPPPARGLASPRAVPPPPPLMVAPRPSAGPLGEATVTGARTARDGLNGNGPNEKLGTAHGPREWSRSEVVAFVRATTWPETVKQIEYDTYDNLVASGVIPHGRPDEHRPRAFPSRPHGEGYVPDPPDER